MVVRRAVVAAACVAALAVGRLAWAEELGLQSLVGGFVVTPSEATVGWKFWLSEAVTVTHLGLWDSGMDGLLEDRQVGIWTAAGVLVPGAEATVPIGGGGDEWRWIALPSAVALAPGEYVIGAWYPYKSGDECLVRADGITTAPWLEFAEYRYVNEMFTYPSEMYAGAGISAFGPNFKGDPVPVPEPALLQLPLLLGLGGASVWMRRRRQA